MSAPHPVVNVGCGIKDLSDIIQKLSTMKAIVVYDRFARCATSLLNRLRRHAFAAVVAAIVCHLAFGAIGNADKAAPHKPQDFQVDHAAGASELCFEAGTSHFCFVFGRDDRTRHLYLECNGLVIERGIRGTTEIEVPVPIGDF